ncbi:MAG TPA: PEP-CTERM sorting domain-containing protein [Gemmataceae bacterium]|nr:PEP-CTERM sorting domain-containing protein [Gemmataceae bacterium]
MRANSFLYRTATMIVVFSALPGVTHAGITGFGDFSNFTINKSPLDSGPSPNIFPNKIELTDSAGSETRSIFYNVPQDISTFSASFTYQATGGAAASAEGATFCLQKTSQGAHAVDISLSGFGFNGLVPSDFPNRSAGLSLELSSPSGTSLYTQGSVTLGGANHTAAVNLLSGDPINVSLTYNGTILHETLTDAVTNAQSSFSYLINLPQLMGGSTAYVGFTAQTPAAIFGFVPEQQYFSDLQFNAVPEPSTIGLAAAGLAAIGFLGLRRRMGR